MGGNVVLKLSLVSRKRTFFARGNEIHYIGGTEILPAPLDAVEEQKIRNISTGRSKIKVDREKFKTCRVHSKEI